VTSGVLMVKAHMKQIRRNLHKNRRRWAFNAMGIKAGSDLTPTIIYLDALEADLPRTEKIKYRSLDLKYSCTAETSPPVR
jgi:hypothetical protein